MDNNLSRRVVYKGLKPGVSQKRLLDELAALSAIRSDHVVQVFDVIRSQSGDVVGLVEEYIDGHDLTCVGHGTFSDIISLVYAIAHGIADIHAHGRVHRDLKPENMKIDKSGILKIFDFGLAKPQEELGTKAFFFSSGFAAPEAFQKNALGFHEFDYAVDVFAFGAIAYWLANEGQLPAELQGVPAALPPGGMLFDHVKLPPPPAVCEILNRTVQIAANRPSMDEVRTVLKKEILRGSHRMLLTFDGKNYFLDSNNAVISLAANGNGIELDYNGLGFIISKLEGYVEINNIIPKVGDEIKGSVVIVLGALGTPRDFITADVSHPEVTK